MRKDIYKKRLESVGSPWAAEVFALEILQITHRVSDRVDVVLLLSRSGICGSC